MSKRYGVEAFTAAFFEALLWSETDEASEGGDGSYAPDTEIVPEDAGRLVEECRRFYEAHAATWDGQCSRGSGEYTEDEQAGHDFALTRNRHGAGFWDGDWTEEVGQALTEACKAFGSVSLYRGDDGRVYVG